MTKKFTIQEVIDAIRKNGYPQTTGTMVSRGGKKILGACAIGQAGLNLKVDPYRLADGLNDSPCVIKGDKIDTHIMRLNDELYYTLTAIADDLESKLLPEEREKTISVFE